jgi:hypothetical protein
VNDQISQVFDNDSLRIFHNAGFFSCCSVRISEIVEFFNTFKKLPRTVDSSFQFSAYKTANKDLTPEFFKTLDDEFFYKRNIICTREDQWLNYKTLDFEGITPFVKKYFSLSDRAMEMVKSFESKYQFDYDNIISVFYRGLDKNTETGIAPFEEFIMKADELYKDNKSFFIQTDTEEFRNAFTSTFKNSFYLEEAPVSNANAWGVMHNLVPIDKRESLALTILASTYMISKTHSIITHTGNCGLWSMYYRGNANNIYQYFQPKDTPHKREKHWLI